MTVRNSINITWIDYTMFIIMLALSAVIGLYHGFKRKKGSTIDEYLFGGRKIPSLPVILSNMASNISSVGMVLVPVETYYYGGQLFFVPVGELIGALLLYNFYLPVFYDLKYTSIFEYLEKRFNRTTRLLGSAIFTITQIFYALIIMYSSCMAIVEAFPVPFYLLTTLVCSVCTIYTVMGGIRGVVWSDFLQSIFMYASIITIISLTVYNVGGMNEVINIADNGGRLNILNFDPSPFSRYSAWSIVLSSSCFAAYNGGTNPGIIQRYLSLPNYSKVKKVAMFSGLANVMMSFLSITMGLAVYTAHYNCDPLMSKAVTNSDQIIPYHIMKMDNSIPGLTGLFLAGILSAALSSLSTMMNSLSGIIFDDFIKPNLSIKWNNYQTNFCIKTIVITLGLVVTVGIFGLNPTSGAFQLFRTLTSLTGGFIIFIFAFGMFYRRANEKSAIIGAIAGVITSTWIGIGSQNAIASGKIQYITKILSIEGCPENFTINANLNITTSGSSEYISPVIFDDDVPYMYRITFSLLMFIGVSVSVCVGIFASLFTNNKNNKVDDSLLIPHIRRKRNNVTGVTYDYDYTECKRIENETNNKAEVTDCKNGSFKQ